MEAIEALKVRYEAECDRVRSVWRAELPSEVKFWDGWIASNWGGTSNWEKLLDTQRPLDRGVTDLIDAAPGAVVRVLDVGAGPLTALGQKWDGRRVIVSAVDPLADEYRKALERKNVVPPTWTQKGDAEALTELFAHGTFDYAYASNCLDHSYNPLKAFREVVSVLKPGCTALLEHASNEAVFERYTGLHQWNFEVRNGEFVIWRPGLEIFAQEALADICLCETSTRRLDSGREWISLRLRKLREGERVYVRRIEIDRPAAAHEPAGHPPLRYVLADRLNGAIKINPVLHRAIKRTAAILGFGRPKS
jgi:SAM-dependent methyltransferase